MSKKYHTHAWVNKDGKKFPALTGTKKGYAWDLIQMREEIVSYPLSPSHMTGIEASNYLESCGWKWVKI